MAPPCALGRAYSSVRFEGLEERGGGGVGTHILGFISAVFWARCHRLSVPPDESTKGVYVRYTYPRLQVLGGTFIQG